MAIVIAALREGFRRAGVCFSKKPHEFADDHFTPEALAILEAEPMLSVTRRDGAPENKPPSLEAEITEVIKALPPEHFGADGKPKLDALRLALGERFKQNTAQGQRLNAALRDQIWADLLATGFEAPQAEAE